MDNNRTYYSREAELRSARKQTLLTIVALGVGASIGAAVGLMFAPNTGEKTREELTNSLEQGFEQSVNRGHEMVDPTLKRIEKELTELRNKVETKVEEWRNA